MPHELLRVSVALLICLSWVTAPSAAAEAEIYRASESSPIARLLSPQAAEQAATSTGTWLNSGQPVTFHLPASDLTQFYTGATGGFIVFVPKNSTSLTINLTSLTPGADLDLFVRAGKHVGPPPGLESDFQSISIGTSTEQVVINAASTPALLSPGAYFVSLLAQPSATPITATIQTTVATASQFPIGITLESGVSKPFTTDATSYPTVISEFWGARIEVPAGATQLRIRAVMDDPSVEIELLARQGFDVDIDGFGTVFHDWRSGDGSADESLVITPSVSPTLKPGTVFIGFGIQTPGGPYEGDITATVVVGDNPPVAWATPSLIDLNTTQGTPPPTQNIDVSNLGSGTMSYTVSANQSWIKLISTSGSVSAGPVFVPFDIDVSGLAVGTHSGFITVSGVGANTEANVQVRITVSPVGQPAIEVSPSSLSFTLSDGEVSDAKLLKIRNGGSGILNFTVESQGLWLNLNVEEGSSAGQWIPVTVEVNQLALGPGNYNGSVVVRDKESSATKTVPVTMEVVLSAPKPAVDPDHLEFQAELGAGNPPSKLFLVSNGGTGTLNYTISSNAAWLTANPSSGSVGGGAAYTTALVNVAGLGVGNYNAQLKVKTVGEPETPLTTATVNVTLSITEPLAVPDVAENGVVNGASFAVFGAPSHATAPGTIVSIFGTNFAASAAGATAVPLSFLLNGVSVTFNGLPAALFYVSPGQINAQMPYGINGSSASIVVTNGDGPGVARNIQTALYSPGIFTFSQSGSGQAVATFATGDSNGKLVAPVGTADGSRPAHAEDIITLWTTGLGAVDPPIADGRNSYDPDSVFRLRTTVTRPVVRIGGFIVPDDKILFSGLAPAYVGLYQINVKIPEGLPPGNAQPVTVSMGALSSRGDVTIAIE